MWETLFNHGVLNVEKKEDFSTLIDLVINDIEEKNRFKSIESNAVLRDDYEINDFELSNNEHSTWGAFKIHMAKKNIDTKFVEEDVKDIVKSLKDETYNEEPFKGLVVGNVQSGKTNNMEGVIAAAGDNGINLFIVISGIVTNLKDQTRKRFIEDIRELKNLNLNWTFLDLKNVDDEENKLLKLSFDNNKRYVAVVLKQSNWLENLNRWICGGSENTPDFQKMKQMKVLVIDDEADQASIDIRDVDNEKEIQDERSRINAYIIKLVNNKNFRAMNYLAYTATPYANILNEYKLESLYPKNFIKVLNTPSNYFGAKQIFGYDEITTLQENNDNVFSGLDIVREIPQSDIEIVKLIHNDDYSKDVESLNKAICWFLISSAYFRKMSFKKPASMLIHTSHIQSNHDSLEKYVLNFFNKDKNQILSLCKNIYVEEVKRFSLNNFKEQLPCYDSNNIIDYLYFDSLEPDLRIILNDKPSGIPLDSDGQYNFNKDGVFLCVDDSKPRGDEIENIYHRLAYPDKELSLNKAPLFIVIGGNTLSRGLTIEGLTTSYFIRNASAADTLMQMGRWFGYRKGYELYQRIFMTDKTRKAYIELTKLEEELKHELYDMKNKNLAPKDYAPKVRNIAINITAKNKLQSAQSCEYDYSSTLLQIFKFDKDENTIANNLSVLTSFIDSIDKKEENVKENIIYKGIDFNLIKDFILKFNINKNIRAFGNKEVMIKWIEKSTQDNLYNTWNVVLSSNETSTGATDFKRYRINWCKRTALRNTSTNDSYNIGALNNPQDLIVDIDFSKVSDELIKSYKKHATKEKLNEIRKSSGYIKNPLLVVYLIDPHSKAKEDDKKRISLCGIGDQPIPAFSIFLPGDGEKTKNYIKYLSVPIVTTLNGYDIEEKE